MLLNKKGFPEEDELVLCKVTNIQYNSVFAKLSEYDHSGMMHISEISAGRIRNIREYVTEGKVIVCKVLRINKERSQIDLSLRRVTESQRRAKVNEVKQGQVTEKIIEFVAKKLNKDTMSLYKDIRDIALKKNENIYSFFEDVSFGNAELEKEGLPKELAKELDPLIKQRIKPPEVSINGTLKVTSYEPNGVDIVREALMKIEKAGKENISIYYLGSGNYKLSIKAEDYKEAEEILSKTIQAATTYMDTQSNTSTLVFERADK